MYPKAAIALLLSGVRAASASDCFCAVEGTGICRGSPGTRLSTDPYTSTSEAKARCEEFCYDKPGCVGFSVLDDADGDDKNCYLYNFVPGELDAGTPGRCFGKTGDYDGFVELPRRGDTVGPCGGLCRAPIYAGKNRCDFDDYLESPECNEPESYIAAKSLQDCKDFCVSRGDKCQGFDFDQGKADAGSNPLSCYERRYKPTSSSAPSSSSKYNFKDEFCHARVCKCEGVPPPVARDPGFPKETCNRTSRPTPPPTTKAPTTSPTRDPCTDDDDWVSINPGNGDVRTCENYVNSNKRCKKFGFDRSFNVVKAADACPTKCDINCPLFD